MAKRRVLVTADIHVDAYMPYSEIGQDGVPSRLSVFSGPFADRLLSVAKKHDVEDIIIAGDLLNSATNRPMVLNHTKLLLEKLASHGRILLTHGNHDWDGKAMAGKAESSSVVFLYGKDSVKYCNDETVESCGKKVHFRGWREHFKLSNEAKGADVLVAHGLVKGAAFSSGLECSHGFDPEELSKMFRMSVIGDIHVPQLLYGNVLIPGSPIQNSFRDPVKSYVWVIEDWKTCKKVRIDGEKFHKFVAVSNEEEVKELGLPDRNPSLLHLRMISEKAPATKSEDSESESFAYTGNLDEIIDAAISNKQITKPNAVKKLVKRFIAESSGSPRNHLGQRLRVLGVSIRNFRSIVSLDLAFPKDEPLLLLGDSGSGKTSILEAIAFALFGMITTKSTKDEIACDFALGGETKVEVTLRSKKGRYIFRRTLDSREIEHPGGTERISARDWETRASEILSVTRDEFMELLYYSQAKGTLVGSLSPSTQSALFSMVLGLDDIDDSAKKAKAEYSRVDAEVHSLSGEIKAYENQLDRDSVKEIGRKLAKIEESGGAYLHYSRKNPAFKPFNSIGDAETRIEEVTSEMRTLEYSRSRLERELKEVGASKSCPTCGQKISSSTKTDKSKLQADLDKAVSGFKKLQAIAAKLPSKSELDSLRQSLYAYKRDKQEFAEMTKKVQAGKSSVKDLRERQQKLLSRRTSLAGAVAVLSPSGIYPLLLESLTTRINIELESMLEGMGIKIKVSPFRYNLNGSPAPGMDVKVSFFGAPERRYQPLSEGQKRFVDLALMIVLNNMILERGCLSLLILDEIFVYAGSNLVEQALQILGNSKAATMLVVTHDFNVEKAFQRKVTLRLEKKLGTKAVTQEGS